MNQQDVIDAGKKLDELLASAYPPDEPKGVFTPWRTLGREIARKLPSVRGAILVVSDLGLLYTVLERLIAEKHDFSRVVFVAHNPQQERIAEKFGLKTGSQILQIGYNNPYNDSIAQLEKHLMGLKFDIIVGNPPYLKGMHMKFLNLCFKSLSKDGELIFIHPASPFIKQGQGVKDFDAEMFKHIKQLELMNPAIAFGGSAQLASPVSVTHMTGIEQANAEVMIDGRVTQHETLETISIHAGIAGYEEFKQRMLAQPSSLRDIVIYPKDGKYGTDCEWLVELSGLVGDFPRDTLGQQTVADFFAVCFFFAGRTMQVTSKSQAKAANKKYAFAFKDRKHAQYCLDFLQTKFARAGLAVYKYNLNIYGAQLSTTPVVDFTRSWSDAELFDQFQLTEDERNFVRLLPNIYLGYHEQFPASQWRNDLP